MKWSNSILSLHCILSNPHCNMKWLRWHFNYLSITMSGRKTYTLNFRTIKKRCYCGVVAKPGIATGSRSNKQGFIREWYPWIRGSNAVLRKHNRIHPFGPTLNCHKIHVLANCDISLKVPKIFSPEFPTSIQNPILTTTHFKDF